MSAPTLVQQKTASATATNVVVTLDALPNPGNSLILLVSRSAGIVTSVVGGGVTWAADLNVIDTGVRVSIMHGHGSDGSNAIITYTLSTSQTIVVNVSEWSGLNNAVPEATNSNTGVASSIVTTNSVTPVSTNSLVIAAGGWTADDYLSGPINGFTRMTQGALGAVALEGAWQVESAVAAYSTGWSLTAGINWGAAVAAFGAPASGGGAGHNLMTMGIGG